MSFSDNATIKVGLGVLLIAWAAWLLGAGTLGERVGSDAIDYNSGFSCAVPGGDSQYGAASWSFWPPGETCRGDHGRVFRAPMPWRSDAAVLVGIGVVVLPIATLMLARRDRVDGDADSLALDELVT